MATINGDNNNNNLVGTTFPDTINGLGGDDTLTGDLGNDLLDGGTGNDSLIGGVGTDTMIGGTGNDTFVVDNLSDVVTEAAGEGTDLVQSSFTGYVLTANVENLTLTGTAVAGTGNILDNILNGNASDNILDGGAGNDTLIGGAGNDTYVVDSPLDVVTESAGAGTDLIQSSVSYTLSANVENLTLTGSAAINGTGNSLGNVLIGNGGNNSLSGGAGNDTINPGQGGNDTVGGGAGSDLLVFDYSALLAPNRIVQTDNGSTDTINLFNGNNSNFRTDISNYTGIENVNMTGSQGNDLLAAYHAGDVFDGQGGTDGLDGVDLATQSADISLVMDAAGSLVTLPGGGSLIGIEALSGSVNLGTGNDLASFAFGSINGTVTLDEGAGNDLLVLDYSALLAPNRIVQSDNGNTYTIAGFNGNNANFRNDILNYTGVETVHMIGSQGNDLLAAYHAGDVFDGQGGTDALDGVDLATQSAPISLVMDAAGSLVTLPGGGSLIGIEALSGSVNLGTGNDLASFAFGSINGTVTLDEGAGNDLLVLDYSALLAPSRIVQTDNGNTYGIASFNGNNANFRNDILNYTGAETVHVIGSQGNDNLAAYRAGQVFDGQGGTDALDGVDLATQSAPISLVMDAAGGAVTLPGGGSLTGIEALSGSVNLGTGNDLASFAFGSINGTVTLDEGAGNDLLVFDYSALLAPNRIVQTDNGNTYTIAGFNGNNVNSRTDILNYTGVETVHVIGSQGNDSLAAYRAGQVFDGQGGTDALDGVDLATQSAPISLVMDAAGGAVTLPGGGSLTGIEALSGSVNLGTGNDLASFAFGSINGTVTLDEGAGNDLLVFDYSALLAPNRIVQTDNGNTYTIAGFNGNNVNSRTDILNYTGVETVHVIGSQGNDNLAAYRAGQVFDGQGGTDALDGVDLATQSAPISLVMDAAGGAVTLPGGGSLTGIEALSGSVNLGTGNDLASFAFGSINGTVTLDEGAGNDLLVFDYSALLAPNRIVQADNGNTYTIAGFNGNNVNFRNDILNYTGVETVHITGSQGNDSLNGNTLPASIFGANGNDTLTGGSGNDLLDGGAGNDSMTGGLGNDTVVLDNAADVAVEAPNGGIDLIRASFSFTMGSGSNFENLELLAPATAGTGDGGDNVITGNALANTLDGAGGNDTLFGLDADDTLTGGDGNDSLDGGLGNDSMAGGLGNDTYVVDGAGDIVTEAASEGTDLVESSVSFTLGANLENLTLTGAGAINGTGNSLNNTLTGNGAANLIKGGTGNDTMAGGAGNDTYVVESAGDTVTEGASAGTDLVQSSVSLTLGANLENLTLTGAGAINGTGNSLGNVLTGNGAANLLDGGAGNDTMAGGVGNDTYVVDSTGDVVMENPGEGTDLVQAGANFTLGAELENLTLTGSALTGTGNAVGNVITGNANANTLDGGSGVDTMAGGAGNDTYVVDSTGDVITENPGEGTDIVQASASFTLGAEIENLTLTGTAVAGTGNALGNILTGNASANTLDGGAGADTMAGGLGNDTYVVDNAADVVNEGAAAGNDLVQSSITLTLAANVEKLILTGTGAINGTGNSLANTITGNPAANILNGGTGDDTMAGGGGNDTYVVDSPQDVVNEGAGGAVDTVQSSATFALGANVENLKLTGATPINGTGNTLDNAIVGNGAANVIDGGAGNDTMTGGTGDDTYVVDSTGDVVAEPGAGGTDLVQSGVNFTLGANLENLTLTGSALTGTGNAVGNVITGNANANTLDGGAGDDTMAGGAGDDTYVVDSAGDVVTENSGEGTDLVRSGVNFTLGANLENLTLTGSALTGTGNALGNVITGDANANTLDGGAGADTLVGGAGNDTYVVDNAGDVVIENPGEGTDLVQSSVNFALGAEVENLTLTGTAATGTGNVLGNVITGNANANTLDGGAGADTLVGGLGDDTYIADNSGDVVTEAPSEGTDLVQSSATYALGANIENLTLTGASAANGTGNALNNVITGNGAANSINGGSGDDTMIGGLGDDTYAVNSTLDVITEASGEGTDSVSSSVALTLGGNLENLTLTGSGAINGTGNSVANKLTGNSGNNVLTGLGGPDTLIGGAGIDTLIGGVGNDSYTVDTTTDIITELSGGGTDTVSSSVSYVLGAQLEKLTLTGSSAINGTGNTLSDTLTGNTGSNILDGTDGTGASLGVGETDTLTGGKGADVFVLGTAAARYYDDGNAIGNGAGDYAFVSDLFPSTGDKLQLQGAATDYVLGASPAGTPAGTGVFIDADHDHALGANDELVAVVKNTAVSLTLDVNYV